MSMRFGLIGEHLSHSFSPQIHNYLGNCDYQLKELRPSELEPFLTSGSFIGINVTIPYKQRVIPYLDSLSKEATSVRAVNTILCRDGKLIGYNTDYYGLISLIHHSGIEVLGKKVLILGAGGAAATASAAVKDMGAIKVAHATRNPKDGELKLTFGPCVKEYSEYEIIINATPVGMYPDSKAKPVDINSFPNLTGVIDCVYNPLRTELVLDAQFAGIKAEGGLYMLVAQACKAHGIFFDCSVSKEMEENIYKKLMDKMENIVLCGMPSCGKSTVGRSMAKEKGVNFIDTDSLIVERCGKSISEIFNSDGEAYFRKIESQIISELSEIRGSVIALGGGAVLSHENVTNLKKNGKIIFINTPLEFLKPSSDRPLSQSREALEALYKQRLPIYLSVADAVMDNFLSPESRV